jgi:HNH endonuclease
VGRRGDRRGRTVGAGGDAGGAGPQDPETCRRLACDSAVTRVVVSRHPDPRHDPHTQQHPGAHDPTDQEGLTGRLRTALALLPPVLGGAPARPLEVGRTSRVVSPAQRAALAVRDGGCGFPGCDRPLGWCEAHHLRHWLHGGPTDLENLALLCRAHHRAVHEGGWRLTRGRDGRLAAAPPHRRPQRAPAAA